MSVKNFIETMEDPKAWLAASGAALKKLAEAVERELAKLAEDFTSGQTALLNEIEELRARVKALENTTAQDKAN